MHRRTYAWGAMELGEAFLENWIKVVFALPTIAETAIVGIIELVGGEVIAVFLTKMEEMHQQLFNELGYAYDDYIQLYKLVRDNKQGFDEYTEAREAFESYLSASSHEKRFSELYSLLYPIQGYQGITRTVEFIVNQFIFFVDQLKALLVDYSYQTFCLNEETAIQIELNRLYEAAPYTLELPGSPRITSEVHSPVEIRIYDSRGRVTGIVNGEEKNEIPYSVYYENAVTVFSPTDSYRLEISGTGEGSYAVSVTRVAGQETAEFTAANVPVSLEATHQLIIDWDALSLDDEKLSIQVDSDGDGTFEEENAVYLSAVGKEEGLSAWAWITIVMSIVLVAAFLVWPRMPRKVGSRKNNSRIKKVKGRIKMAKKQVTIPAITLSGRTAVVAGVIVALLLLVIGAATGTGGVVYAGIFILPLVLFCGGLLLTEESIPVRVTLLVFGGVLLLAIASAAMTNITILGIF